MTRYPSYRYRCDHCKKTGGSGGAMKRHEAACSANPNRICRFCAAAGNTPEPVADLVAALAKGDADGLAALRDLSQGCPACMLAAIRQSGLQRAPGDEDDPGFRVDFDFKAEKAEWWACVNDQRNQDGYY